VYGGNHTCGKCKVKINEPNDIEISEEERQLLTESEIKNGFRLACFIEIKGNLELSISDSAEPTYEPVANLESVNTYDIKSRIKITARVGKYISCVISDGEILSIEGQDTIKETYDIAIDIGTTTLTAYLMNLATGQ
jgi:uncharacterized 2Fe-2S/4Fe-4S cluster protein (DUF4445 family)